jgi:hypothetical protein
MHELIDCRLVDRSAPGVWTLKGDVQRLLEDEYSAALGRPSDRVFVGLRCESWIASLEVVSLRGST